MSNTVIIGRKRRTIVVGSRRTVLVTPASKKKILLFPRSLPGATGPQGPQGPIGNTGPQGEQGNPGAPGIGVPSGGDAGQILAKFDGADYNTEWIDAPDANFQESVTYAQLVALIGASGLTPGKRYLISDFATAHYFLDGATTIAGSARSGPIEQIIVTATATNAISVIAESVSRPGDTLYYDWDSNNWDNDVFYSIGGTIIPNWTGVIYRRIDNINNIDCSFDFRTFLFRVWGITAPVYNAANTYNLGDTVLFGGRMFTCKAYGVTGVATSDAARWQPVFGIPLTGPDKFWATSSSGIGLEVPDIDNFDIGFCSIATDGTFQDFPAFPLASTDSRNIKITGTPGFSAAGFVAKTGCYNTDFSGTQSVFGAVSNSKFKTGCSTIYFSSLDSSDFGASTNTCIGATVIAIRTGTQCRNLFFGEQTNGISLGDNVYNMQFGRDCYYSSINAGNNAQFTSMSGLKAESLSYSKFDALIEDTLVSVGFDYNKFFGSVSGLRVDQRFQSNTFYNQVQFVRFGALCNNNLFNGIVVRTEFGSDYNNNTHNGDCANTRIGNSAAFNVWPGLLNCLIGNDAANNIQSVFSGDYFAVTAGNGFSGNDLGQTENCSFGDGCSNNVGQFVRCVFYNYFSRNTFSATVSDAVGGGNFQNDDYSTATIIYQPGTKQLTTNSAGDKLILYIDGSNVQQITSNLT